jgi:uncharacterized membrane protein
LKIAVTAQIFGILFSMVKVKYKKQRQKMCWASFWGIFSQTHLVTLLGGNVCIEKHQ